MVLAKGSLLKSYFKQPAHSADMFMVVQTVLIDCSGAVVIDWKIYLP